MNEYITNIKDHVINRRMNLDVHTCWFNYDENVATFPFWNLSGKMVGYQLYNPNKTKKQKNDPNGKYYTRMLSNTVCVWGLESWNFSNTLYITEGIFDACRITSNNHSAIAILSNDPNISTKKWLYTIKKIRPVFAICDSDDSGKKLKNLGHESYTMQIGDLGDANEDFVKKLINETER